MSLVSATPSSTSSPASRTTSLVHAVANQEVVLDAGDDVDDGVADTKDIVARICHERFRCRREADYSGCAHGGNRTSALRQGPVVVAGEARRGMVEFDAALPR